MSEPTPFARALAHVLGFENGYADHPKDPGGATNFGITRKTLAKWRRVSPWWTLPKSEVKTLSRREATRIYRAGYWDPAKAGRMPGGLDLAVFDFAVNSGVSKAVKTLQAILGVRTDGLVGPITLRALKAKIAAAGVGALIEALCGRRLGFLKALAIFSVFGRGWTGRVAATRALALSLAPDAGPSQPIEQRSSPMDFLSGYKTYIVAAVMALIGLAQVLGIDVPSFEDHSGGQLLIEGLAVLFLRKGIKTEVGNA